MESRPTTAFILTLLGGLFLLLGTLIGLAFPPSPVYPYYTLPSYFYPFLLTSAICGALVLIFAWLLFMRTEQHVAWGVAILVLSVTGTVGVVTGYFALFGAAGVVFGVIGGALAIGWRTTSWSSGQAMPGMRICSGCGRYIPIAYPYCAYCGTAAPTYHPPSPSPPRSPGTPPS